MRKMSTLYRKDPNDLSRVINEVNPENEWVFQSGVPTQKWDGTAVAIIERELYKRYDAKKGKSIPLGALPCQEADEITGHHPHWIKCERNNPSDKWAFEAFDNMNRRDDGTYELCGPKVQGNPEQLHGHHLLKHGNEKLSVLDFSFEGLRNYLSIADIEGIVFHGPNGEMCKIRKSDFGIKRTKP